MSFDLAFLPLLMTMAAVSFVTRAGGFWLMRFMPTSTPIEAALKATPIAVMVGIVAPAAGRGGSAELAALVVIFLSMKVFGNDLIAAVLGVATVALTRHLLA